MSPSSQNANDVRVGIDFIPDTHGRPQSEVKDQLPSLESFGGWQTFELMPPSYRSERDARKTLYYWSAMVAILFSAAVGSGISLWMRGQRMIERNRRFVAAAEPLRKLRDSTKMIERQNELMTRWSRLAESAKPDDCVLQTMAAVAQATHPSPDTDIEHHLNVQTIHIKLPLEHADETVPTWAEPRFSISATARKRDVVMKWSSRLETIERLDRVEVKTPTGVWRETLVQASGIPLSTRVVP